MTTATPTRPWTGWRRPRPANTRQARRGGWVRVCSGDSYEQCLWRLRVHLLGDDDAEVLRTGNHPDDPTTHEVHRGGREDDPGAPCRAVLTARDVLAALRPGEWVPTSQLLERLGRCSKARNSLHMVCGRLIREGRLAKRRTGRGVWVEYALEGTR